MKIKKPSLKGISNLGHLGHFAKNKHIQRGHNDVEDIAQEPMEQRIDKRLREREQLKGKQMIKQVAPPVVKQAEPPTVKQTKPPKKVDKKTKQEKIWIYEPEHFTSHKEKLS